MLGFEIGDLAGSDEKAADGLVLDLDGYADHALDPALDSPFEGVLPGRVVVHHDHLAGLPDLAGHSLPGGEAAGREVDRVVVGEHPDALTLEPDQRGAPAGHDVAGTVRSQAGERAQVEHPARGDGQLVEDMEARGL